MNRLIKFRAWSDRDKKMVYFTLEDLLDLQGKTESDHLGIVDYPNNRMYETVMQFTGLKDKNGKEIFEGDVVEALDKHAWVGDYDFIKQAEIVWWDKGFYAKTEIGNLGFYENNVGVIGNIFENPELLKGSK